MRKSKASWNLGSKKPWILSRNRLVNLIKLAQAQSILIDSDRFAPSSAAQGLIDADVDRSFEEMHRAVAEQEITAAGMPAGRVAVVHLGTGGRMPGLKQGGVAVVVVGIFADRPRPYGFGDQVAAAADDHEAAVMPLAGGQGLREAVARVGVADLAVAAEQAAAVARVQVHVAGAEAGGVAAHGG